MKSIEGEAGSPVWDLPIRLFHWSIVALIGLSWWSAENGGDRVHFWSGYTLLALLIFRILWGFTGSSTARFSSFVRGPAAILGYLRGRQWRGAGHSPLGGLSVLAMLLAIGVQLASGLVQIDDDDSVEGPLSGLVDYETALLAHDVHETSFDVLRALIVLHLLAIAYYRLVRGRSLVLPMMTGRAELPEGVAPMQPVPTGRLVVCAIAALALTAAIVGATPALGS